jgi:hypothetical protein
MRIGNYEVLNDRWNDHSWDAATLAATIDSSYDASCYGGPGGTSTYTFSLQRF